MLKRLGWLLRLLLWLVGVLALLVIAGLWWWLPAGPRFSWQSPYRAWRALVVSPDGRSLLTSAEEGVSLWDLSTGRERATLAAHPVEHMMFSPDSRKVAFRSPGTVWLWELDGLKHSRKIKEGCVNGWPSVFTPDSRTLIIYEDGWLRWEPTTGTEEAIEFPFALGNLDYTNGRFSSGRQIRLWRQADAQLIQIRDDFGKGPLRSVRVPVNGRAEYVFSPDGRLFADADGRIFADAGPDGVKVWDLDTGRELATLRGPESRRISLYPKDRFSPDGRFLVTSCHEKVISGPGLGLKDISGPHLWEIRATPPRIVGNWPDGWIEFSPDSNWLAVREPVERLDLGFVGLVLGNFTIWKPGGSEPHLNLGHMMESPVFAPDGRTVAARIIRVSAAPGRREEWLGWLGLWKQPLDHQPDLEIWDIPQRRLLAAISNCHPFAYSPDGNTLVVLGINGTIHLWDIPPRRPWWIDYGLPVLFALLMLVGLRLLKGRDSPAPSQPQTA